jgi:cation-transporting ATPase E
LSEPELAQRAEETTIFGRITPQQKEHLVRALHSRGRYVAMIGDGVNDVLSLKQADLAIAMETGSQATRAVADIVLLNDSFAVLPEAFREGQRIVTGMQDNLKLFMTRVVFEALLIAAVSAIGGFPFAPNNNAVMTLFTVGIPVVALAAWAESAPAPRGGWGRSLVEFVVPAAVLQMLAGFIVYLMYLPDARVTLLTDSTPLDPARELMKAQSAVTTLAVLCGLLLVPFVSPPTKFLEGPSPASGDWRPTLLALALFCAYIVILAVTPFRNFFDLVPLTGKGYVGIGLIAAVWSVMVWVIWKARLLDRWLGMD